MRIVARRREICLKIVYYGPGLCGKTTNLLKLYDQVPEAARGNMVTLDTETERTLFFDYFPVAAGTIGRYRLKMDYFTVPGQSFYEGTRRAVLDGVDGIVFVADSSPSREQANLVSHGDMLRYLVEQGRDAEAIPRVYQWNKRDVRGALSEKMLQRLLNPEGRPAFGAIAIEGSGVKETQAAISSATLAALSSGKLASAANV